MADPALVQQVTVVSYARFGTSLTVSDFQILQL